MNAENIMKENRELTARLKEYTDTGLTPEQVREMDELYREKCEEVTKLREVCQNQQIRNEETTNTVNICGRAGSGELKLLKLLAENFPKEEIHLSLDIYPATTVKGR